MSAKMSELPNEKMTSKTGQKVTSLLMDSGNCAQTCFAILSEEHGLEGRQILKALTAFPGIALRGETCGAVIGSLMALGLIYGRDDLKDWKGYLGSLPSARRFCARFEEMHGGTTCDAILQEKLGRNFDLADSVDVVAYASSGGPEVCAKIVTSAVKLASKGIEKKSGARKESVE